MRTLITITLLLLGLVCRATAQQGNFEVQILDAEEGTAIPYVTVQVICLAANCDSVQTLRTDKLGKARLPFSPPVLIRTSHVAYATFADTLRSTSPSMMGAQTWTLRLHADDQAADHIVVTGQFRPTQSGESLHQVRVISGEEIEARGAQTLRDLMSSEINVRINQDNILGSGLNIQGLSGQNVKILVDGVPVVGRVGGNIDISQLPLNNIERVEIVEGPLSVAYGTDALGGVVNLITNRKIPTNLSAEATAYHESVGTWNFDGNIGLLFDQGRIQLSGGRYFFGGFSRPDTSRARKWKPREQYFLDWSGTWYSGTFALEYNGKYFNEYILNRGMPRAPYGETAFDETYKTQRLTNRIQGRGTIGAGRVEFSAALSDYTRRRNTWFKDLVTLEEQLTPLAEDQDTTGFRSWNIRGTYSGNIIDDVLAWQGGTDINLDQATGDRIESGEQAVEDYALFGSVRYMPAANVAVQPGLRYAWNSEYDAPLIPSLNIRYAPQPTLTLRASYARGFRAPSLQDLYFFFVDINHNIQGNQELLAEVSDNFSASLSWEKNRSDHRLGLSLSGFYNDISNLITLANVQGDLYSYENIGTYRSTGWNLTGEYGDRSASLAISGGMIGRYNALSQSESAPEFSFSPEVTLAGQWKITGIADWAVDYKYTGSLPSYGLTNDGELTEQSVEDYHTLNSSLSRAFFDDLLTLRAGVKNLFDVTDVKTSAESQGAHSSSASSLPVSWGRTFFLNLTVAVR